MLPDEQKAHVVGGRDRLDLRAQPAQRVAVNAREQPSIAPLQNAGRFVRCCLEAAPQDTSLGFECEQRGLDVRFRNCERPGEGLRGRGTEDGEATAQELNQRLLTRPYPIRPRCRRANRRIDLNAWMQGEELGQTFRRDQNR